MPTTYAQSVTYYEDGIGTVEYRLLISDTYEGLTATVPTLVGIFDVDGTKSDLDVDTGVFAADELSISMHADWLDTTDDAACLEFVLEARDAQVQRFCAMLVNPHTPIESSDFDFRGIIQPDMNAEEKRWSGAQYESDPAPVRVWQLRALSYDTTVVLGAKVADIVAAIDPAWILASVADRTGYFKETSGPYGYREARFGNLVLFSDLIQELLNQAAPTGITLTYITQDTDFYACPARFERFITDDGVKLRYPKVYDAGITSAPHAFHVTVAERVRLRASGDANTDGSLYVSWKMLTPSEAEKPFSWLKYETLADLLYALAVSLNMYLTISYVSSTEIQVQFSGRSVLIGGPCFVRDVIQAQLALKPLTVDEKRQRWIGNAHPYLREGFRMYNYDGGFRPNRAVDAPQSDGEMLPLTVSPSVLLLENTGEDGGYDLGEIRGYSLLPHGAIFYDSPTAPKDKAAAGWAEYNAAKLHTGMYIRMTGQSEATYGEVGVDGQPVFLPVAYLQGATANGDKWIGTQTDAFGNFVGLAEYLNEVRLRDRAYFQGEYELTVFGLMGFRTTAGGLDDWRHVGRASKITLDGVEWMVRGIERQYRDRRTVLRLHVASRFALPLPSPGTAPADDTGAFFPPPKSAITNFYRKSAGATITAYTAVVIDSAGLVWPARAHHDHFGLFAGIALNGGAVGEEILVQCGDRILLPDRIWTAGNRVYVRTAVTPATDNLSLTALTVPDADEDMVFDIGYTDAPRSMVVQTPFQVILQ